MIIDLGVHVGIRDQGCIGGSISLSLMGFAIYQPLLDGLCGLPVPGTFKGTLTEPLWSLIGVFGVK